MQTFCHDSSVDVSMAGLGVVKCYFSLQELQGRRRGAPVGLSNMAHSLLGKPLNKAMQASPAELCNSEHSEHSASA